ncbi:MAG: META domain-containing protein [Maritimibacter sp.]|nr:META domain-containing protein [Maritimibacter sp.]
MIRLSLTLAAATLALAACSGPAPVAPGANVLPAAESYQDQVWELELVDGAVFSARPVRATVEFSRNGYAFNGACNSRSGNYVLGSAGMLVMTPGEQTEVACADPADARFFALVDAVTELRVTRAGLSLMTADGREMAFRPYS